MKPEEIILALKICGNHLAAKDLSCDECPNKDNCMTENDRLLIEAAELIEKLMEERG